MHYLCARQQTVVPPLREGGVLYLRVARKLCIYVSSRELSPSPSRVPLPLLLTYSRLRHDSVGREEPNRGIVSSCFDVVSPEQTGRQYNTFNSLHGAV